MAAGGRRTARSRRSRGVCAERRGAAPAVCAGERDDCGGRRPSRGSGPASGGRGGGSMVCRDARRPPARALPSRGRALGPGRGVGDRGCDLGRSLGSGCPRSGCPDPSRDLRRPSSRGCPPTSSSGRPPPMRWPRCERGSARSESIRSRPRCSASTAGCGGDIAALMRRLAAASADRDRMADEARTATTQARFTGLLVVALPAGAALFAELLQPGFIARVSGEPASAAMLIAAAGLQLVGFAVIRRLGGRRVTLAVLLVAVALIFCLAAAIDLLAPLLRLEGGTRRARSRCTRARATAARCSGRGGGRPSRARSQTGERGARGSDLRPRPARGEARGRAGGGSLGDRHRARDTRPPRRDRRPRTPGGGFLGPDAWLEWRARRRLRALGEPPRRARSARSGNRGRAQPTRGAGGARFR